jgi:hypothetical protein
MHQPTFVGAVAASVALFASCGQEASTDVARAELSLPVQLVTTSASTLCRSAAGATITFGGSVEVQGAGVRLVLTNNAQFTHETSIDVASELAVVPATFTIDVPSSSISSSSSTTRTIWIEIVDDQGSVLAGPVLVASCADPSRTVSTSLALPAELIVHDASTTDCVNHAPGATVMLDGALRLSALSARLLFADGDDLATAHVVELPVTAAVIVASRDIAIPKQPVHGGVGGNPWIYVEPIDAAGHALAEPTLIGRCVDFASR